MEGMDMSRFAPMNHVYRFFELEDYVKSVAGLGYESIDLWTCGAHFLVDDHGYEDVGFVKGLLKKYHVNVVSITPEQSCPKPYSMAVKKKELRQKARNYFQNVVLAAHELECPVVSINSGWQFYSETRQEAWKRSVEMVGDLCHFAEAYGVRLSMETLSRQSTLLVNRLGDLKRMIDDVASANFSVTVDIHTIHNAGESLQDYFDTFGSRLNHCHFMDYRDGVRAHLAWGDGQEDPGKVLQVFRRNGYAGNFVLEFTDAKYFPEPGKAYGQTMRILKTACAGD